MADELEALEELRKIRDILETCVLEHLESLDGMRVSHHGS